MHGALSENCSSETGAVTPKLLDCYREAALEGEMGIIITGLAYVNKQGQKWPHQMGIWNDELIPGLSRLAALMQEKGSKAFIQLAHAGVYSSPQLTGYDAVGPSSTEKYEATPGNRAMTLEEISLLIDDYGKAACRAREAGFSGVELHAAHGYGLCQFLSATFNKRGDIYGGNPRNRARMVTEVLQSIAAKAGKDYPVIVKMNGDDLTEDGSSLDECLSMALDIEKAGAAAIEVSGGMNFNPDPLRNPTQRVNPRNLKNEAYFRDLAREFHKALRIPLALVGGIRSIETAEKLIGEGYCDLVSLSRPFIRNPRLLRDWQNGSRQNSDCVSCNRCLSHSRTEGGLECVIKYKNLAASQAGM